MPPAKSQRSVKNKKAITPVPSSSPEVVAETVEEMLAESPTPPVKSKSTKKATIPVMSDSDIEIIETPAPLKKVKKVSKPAPAKPAPASSEFEQSPPVTITKKNVQKAAAAAAAKKLSFGTLDSEDDSPTVAPAKPASPVKVLGKRVSRPSVKAQYMKKESTPGPVSSDSDLTPPPPEQAFTKVLARSKKSAAPEAPQPSPELGHDGAPAELSDMVESGSDEDSGHTADNEASTPLKKRDASRSSATAQLLGKRRAQSPAEEKSEDEVPLAAASKATTKKATTKKARIEAVKPDRSDDEEIMECSDNEEKELPKGKKQAMHPPCSLLSFSSLLKEAHFRGEATDLQSSLPLYEAVSKQLSQTGKKNFERAFYFHSDGIIVNPAQASAHDAGVSPGREARVVAAGGRNPLLFISNGCVASCNLFIPDSTGVGLNRSNVKRISVWLLNEEFDAMTSYFGTVYGTSQFYCHYLNDVIAFQTIKDGAGAGSAGGSSSPKKASSLFGSRSGTAHSTAASLSFPPALRFNETVPIYDIRKQPFKFTTADFASLATLPLYYQGLRDLPQDSAVSVGYTVNTFPYTQGDAPSNSRALSLNVQFVLLHGEIVVDSD